MYLEVGYTLMSLADLTRLFNERFGTDRSEVSIRAATRNHGFKSGRTGCFAKGGKSWNSGRKGWTAGGRSAETRFKKGEMRGAAQHNYRPIGSIRVTVDGFLEQKVNDTAQPPARRWVGVHRLNWEAAHGPIPEGHVVVFLDGDSLNCDLDNLRCVHRGVLGRMNKAGLSDTYGEARKAAILTFEIDQTVYQARATQ